MGNICEWCMKFNFSTDIFLGVWVLIVCKKTGK